VDSDAKWRLIHKYRSHAARGMVPVILCPDDNAECVPSLGEDGDPVLRCIQCNSIFDIGLKVFDQMKKNLKEINV
jgi:hypothetical protein